MLARRLPTHTDISQGRMAQRGFTLIEVLVAMFIVAFGLLGIVGTNLASLKLQADSANRSRAALHAQDILDRMRANAQLAAAGSYNVALGAALPTPASAIVQTDLQEWASGLAQSLPNGTGSIAVSNAASATVTVQWFERESRGGAGANRSFVFTSQL